MAKCLLCPCIIWVIDFSFQCHQSCNWSSLLSFLWLLCKIESNLGFCYSICMGIYDSFLSCVKNVLLKKERATHSSILAWRIPWTEEPGELSSTASQSQTRLSTHACIRWRGERGWFGDDSSTLRLLCTLFLLLLHQLHLRSSGIRSWSLGTPALPHSPGDFAHGKFSYVLFLFGRHIPVVLQWGWFGPLWSIWRCL